MALFSRPTQPRFVPLTTDAAMGCAALHGSAFAHGWSEVEFERLLAADSSYGDATLMGSSLAGFILSRAAGDEAEVLTIVVAKAWRNRGLARALLARHMDQLATVRVRSLFLEVNTDNAAARALYARAGFAEVGRRKGYYPTAPGARPADALVLRRTLG